MVNARGREWVVLPETRGDLLKLRPLGGTEKDATLIYLPLEPEPPRSATFDPPNPDLPGSQAEALLLRDALRLKLRDGAGPFRGFGKLNFEPRAYQLVPLLMALKLDPIRLLVADDVGIGKTIEACLIARELIDRGEIDGFTVICPPHLCEQWQQELAEKFSIKAEVVRTGTATRLERELPPDVSIFESYPYTVVSLDYIKSDKRRDDFLRACPQFVIVDEAHACVRSNTNTRHQRYQLLKGLASEPGRSMILLTATPHSGDDTAFDNLLGLLEPKYAHLRAMPEGEDRKALRSELADHFVQRQRGDIKEWKDSTRFPTRESREATYKLTGGWGDLFREVRDYARKMIQRAEGGTKLQQRMSWWAALALLRCVSSSPAAASLALRASEGETEQAQVADLKRVASETIMDEADDDSLTFNESMPTGTVENYKEVVALQGLVERADALRGPGQDPKLKLLINELRKLISEGFKLVVFCRYIATAHYVGDELKKALPRGSTHVEVVTGELTPDQRKERVEELDRLGDDVIPVLVATDCLSEGVNLQNHFNAVIHYDLVWNPTRHEQREGRVDRFGQNSSTVRTLMLYGHDNPVDGAVLRVILRKADKIRKELGVYVPLPQDNKKWIDTIMEAVIFQGANAPGIGQMVLDFGNVEDEVDDAWQEARKRISRTVFAQSRLRPEDVLPEWEKAVSVLGGERDVARFVRTAAEYLGAPLEQRNGYSVLPVSYFPPSLRDHLYDIGFQESSRITFAGTSSTRAVHIHRTHSLVALLADYVLERALDPDRSQFPRASAIFTHGVEVRTVLYLLRLRNHLQVEQLTADGRHKPLKSLLAEECLGVAVRGGSASELLTDNDALSLISLPPGRNMDDGQKTHLIEKALESIKTLEKTFEQLAYKRAQELLADHRRIRDASDARGLRYDVIPKLPVDKIGIYVLMPMASL